MNPNPKPLPWWLAILLAMIQMVIIIIIAANQAVTIREVGHIEIAIWDVYFIAMLSLVWVMVFQMARGFRQMRNQPDASLPPPPSTAPDR